MPRCPDWGWKGHHPVVKVSRQDAEAPGGYLRWAHLEFPTEAQWEKAARGTDGRRFPWGNEWDASRCHSSHKDRGEQDRTASVRDHATGVSPYGIHDMIGNVSEMCKDHYHEDYHDVTPTENPICRQHSTASPEHSVRGGSYCEEYHLCAFDSAPGIWDEGNYDWIGFRGVVRPMWIDHTING